MAPPGLSLPCVPGGGLCTIQQRDTHIWGCRAPCQAPGGLKHKPTSPGPPLALFLEDGAPSPPPLHQLPPGLRPADRAAVLGLPEAMKISAEVIRSHSLPCTHQNTAEAAHMGDQGWGSGGSHTTLLCTPPTPTGHLCVPQVLPQLVFPRTQAR